MRCVAVAIALTSACAEDPTLDTLLAPETELRSSPPGGDPPVAAQAPPPIASSLRAPDLVRGRTAVFQVRGSRPSATSYFARGGAGAGACPPALGGSCLGISAPTVIGAVVADAWGTATLNLPIPAGAPLVTTRIQSAAPTGGIPYMSDVEERGIYDVGHEYAIGNHDPLGNSSSHAPGYVLGSLIQVPDDVTLTGFGVLMQAVGPQAKLALYTDVGGAPATLLAATAAVSPTSLGANEFALPTPVAIPRGTYWLMGEWDTNASIGYTELTSATVAYFSHSFGAFLPSFAPPVLTYPGQEFNYWLLVE